MNRQMTFFSFISDRSCPDAKPLSSSQTRSKPDQIRYWICASGYTSSFVNEEGTPHSLDSFPLRLCPSDSDQPKSLLAF